MPNTGQKFTLRVVLPQKAEGAFNMELELECLVDVSGTAEWRRRKAEQYPEDARNIKAATLLDTLAGNLVELEGSSLHRQLIDLWKENDAFGEVVSEELRSVGFYTFPDTVDELLTDIIERLQA
ncbi:hypothetical protein [Sinorhizobium fredii]|uniref:hypothetical protein n=1 Tax=Rhizobium fredii TaxID=380 RepID=UPI003518D07B